MNKTPLKPWAESHEDLHSLDTVEQTSPSVPAEPSHRGKSSFTVPRSKSPILGSWAHTFARWRLRPLWALGPLGIIAIILSWRSISPVSGTAGLSVSGMLVVLFLALMAGFIILASNLAKRSIFGDLRAAVEANDGNLGTILEAIPVDPELEPVWQAVEKHIANIETRVAELIKSHRKTGLEATLADAQRKQFECVIEAIADPIIVTDAFDQLIVVNNAAVELFGIDREKMLRKPISEIISDERLVHCIASARDADIRSSSRRCELEIGEHAFAAALSSLTAPQSLDETSASAHGVVTLLRDVTREREASKNKSQFVSHVAHELRTPLSSIRAYVEMLVDGEATDAKTLAEYYEIIQASADRLGRLIDNMLNISRIEAGTVRINKEPISVSMVVSDALNVVRPQAEAKKITLTEQLTPSNYRIMADRDLIDQAVLNLLSNAVKYTQEGGRVSVRMLPREDQHLMQIEITDNGVGIPEEALSKVFDKFFRVEENKNVAKGTGLGLNLVKNIVEKVHDGKITLTSKVGQGSTFTMILPLLS